MYMCAGCAGECSGMGRCDTCDDAICFGCAEERGGFMVTGETGTGKGKVYCPKCVPPCDHVANLPKKNIFTQESTGELVCLCGKVKTKKAA